MMNSFYRETYYLGDSNQKRIQIESYDEGNNGNNTYIFLGQTFHLS